LVVAFFYAKDISLVVWAVVQLVRGDGCVVGVWNTRWGVGTARAGEGGFARKNTEAHFKPHAVAHFFAHFLWVFKESGSPKAIQKEKHVCRITFLLHP